MPHIHNKPGQHDHTVSALIFRTDGSEPRVLLHIHKKLKRYIQFGGHIELDENPWQTLLREISEESGYDTSQLSLLQPPVRLKTLRGGVLHPIPLSYGTFPYGNGLDHFHTDSCYLFTTKESPNHQPIAGETKEIKAFSQSELRSLSSSKTVSNTKDLCRFGFECLEYWEAISPADFTLH